MKALTLHQPYASLVALGHKQYETRSWQTHFRGHVAIHAGKTFGNEQKQDIFRIDSQFPELGLSEIEDWQLGCVLVAVRITGMFKTEAIRDRLSPLERACGNYADGRFAWGMEIVRHPASPIPARGKQGLWDWEYRG